MRKFKTGDKIVRVSNGPYYTLPIGFTATVLEGYEYLDRQISPRNVVDGLWELVEDPSKHHKYHDLIIAWAKGAKIEAVDFRGDWQETRIPRWYADEAYRIKPTPPKTDKERINALEARVAELESTGG